MAALAGSLDGVDLVMGTFSKALASSGGFVAGPAEVIDFLRVNSRSYMFTAATPPAGIGAACAAVDIARSDEGEELRAALAANTERLRGELTKAGFAVAEAPALPDGTPVQTPILRIPTGDDTTAHRLWKRLFEAGIYVNVAVYPAVPRGHAQLRVSVMATHTTDHLDHVATEFAALRDTAEAAAAPWPGDAATPVTTGAETGSL